MADIDGGSLHFTSTMDNAQINSAIEETLRRVQGLSDGTVAGGQKMDAAFSETAQAIREKLGQIGAACESHETALQGLEAKYQELGQKAGDAFMAGRDEESRAIQEEQAAVKGEIAVRRQLLDELHEQSNALEEVADKQEKNRQAVAANEQAQTSMRSRIRDLKEEMMRLSDQGIDQNCEAYKRLVDELGRLQDIQGDVAQQGKILANDQSAFQGFLAGLQGVSGGFSAVTGAMSLFSGENENLQKVMTKVQSVMAITMGIQQVSESLNKDSAFRLVTMTKLKGWWADCVAKAAVTETAETAATTANAAAQGANAAATGVATAAETANTVATGAQATAATAGTAANLGLAGAFRLVGVAIKSIPVFGWILSGISALIGLYATFTSKANDAKKAQEDFSKALIDGCYKPIGTIEQLSTAYNTLGNNIKAKEQFIVDNQKRFEELGLSIRSVADAEKVLIKDKDKFIQAQIEKAKALVYTQLTADKVKKMVELQAEVDAMSDTKSIFIHTGSGQTGRTIIRENEDKKAKKQELEDLIAEIKKGYENAYSSETNAANLLKEAGIKAINEYDEGTVGAIEQAIIHKQEALKNLKPNSEEWKKTYADIVELQKQIASPSAPTEQKQSNQTTKATDPYKEKLDAYKKEYERFNAWVNSSDSTIQAAAKSEFSELLKEGETYIDYLKNQRDIILDVDIANRTKEQNDRLRTLNESIAEETKKTVLEAFNQELSDALSNAKSVMEMLAIIEQKRKALANDGTDVDNAEAEILNKAEIDVIDNGNDALLKQQEEEQALLNDYRKYLNNRVNIASAHEDKMSNLKSAGKVNNSMNPKSEDDQNDLLNEYMSFLDRKVQMEQKYNDDIIALEKERETAIADSDRERINNTIADRKNAYTNESQDMSLEQLKVLTEYINTFKDLKNISSETIEFVLTELNKVKESEFTGTAITQLKDLLKLQVEVQEMPDYAPYKANTSSESTSNNVEIVQPNSAKEAKLLEIDALIAEIKKGYESVSMVEKTAANNLKEESVAAVNEYADSTINAIEQAIIHKQEALKNLKPNSEEWKKTYADIAELQKQIASPSAPTKQKQSNQTTKATDPYKEKLDAYKKEYERFNAWVNSSDSTIQAAAKSEFSELLKEGETYIDYLKNQRDIILDVDIANRTKEQNDRLRTLNESIAEETKKTVLEAFNQELSDALSNAKSVMEMLAIIEQKRKALANDGTDVDNAEANVLDEAETNARIKQQEEEQNLLNDYEVYLDKRINKGIEYESRMANMRAMANNAETQEEREMINRMMDMYGQLYDLNIDNLEELQQINEESIYRYGSYEQKRLIIAKDYEKRIGAARLAGQHDVAKKLEGERDLEIMQETQAYKDLFGDVSEIAVKTAENARTALISIIEDLYNKGKVTAEQYKQLLKEINQQTNNAYKGKGWQLLMGENSKSGGIMNMIFGDGDLETKISSIKDLFSSAKGDMANMTESSGQMSGNISGAANGAAGALAIVDAIITAVYQTLKAVADTLDAIADYQDSIGHSDSADNLKDWSDTINTVNETAMSGWDKLKNGDVAGAMSDTISMPFKLLTTLNGIHDKHIDKSIKKHAESVRDLTNAYNQLEWQIQKSLGTDVYKNQKDAIANMKQQQEELAEMQKKEESKKKSDGDKVAQYAEQQAQLERDISDMMSDISADILQTDAKSFADELGDALVEAFEKGTDAAEAFEKSVNEIVKSAILNQLKKEFLEKQLQGALDGLMQSMGWTGDDFTFDGLDEQEINAFKNQISGIANNFNQALNVYSDVFKDLSSTDEDSSLTGAVKGVTEETASMVGGQMNAMRVNQLESIDIMRNQLSVLSSIANNTSYNYHLTKLDRIVTLLENAQQGSSLRSQGLL